MSLKYCASLAPFSQCQSEDGEPKRRSGSQVHWGCGPALPRVIHVVKLRSPHLSVTPFLRLLNGDTGPGSAYLTERPKVSLKVKCKKTPKQNGTDKNIISLRSSVWIPRLNVKVIKLFHLFLLRFTWLIGLLGQVIMAHHSRNVIAGTLPTVRLRRGPSLRAEDSRTLFQAIMYKHTLAWTKSSRLPPHVAQSLKPDNRDHLLYPHCKALCPPLYMQDLIQSLQQLQEVDIVPILQIRKTEPERNEVVGLKFLNY